MPTFPITSLACAPSAGMEVVVRFSTQVVEARSGREQRLAHWAAPRHEFSLTWGYDSAAAVTNQVWEFYVARRGSLL